jgi:hypothetical protein
VIRRVARSSALALCALLAVACEQTVRLGDGRAGDADTGADAAVDSGVDAHAPAVDAGHVPTGFSEPKVIVALSTDSSVDDDPSLTNDLALVYFDSKRDGGKGKEDIWSADRADPSADWNAPVAVDALNTADRETGIALSADGLRIWFSSDRPDSKGGLDVFTAERASRTDDWGAVTRVAELSTDDDDLVSAVNDAETICLLGRRPQGTDDYDMYMAERASDGDSWSSPKAISELDTKANESDAFLLGDGRDLLFTRSKDLQVARRPSATAPFTLVGPLAELNSSDDDRDPWATADLGYVVFSSNRSGSYELYESSR